MFWLRCEPFSESPARIFSSGVTMLLVLRKSSRNITAVKNRIMPAKNRMIGSVLCNIMLSGMTEKKI